MVGRKVHCPEPFKPKMLRELRAAICSARFLCVANIARRDDPFRKPRRRCALADSSECPQRGSCPRQTGCTRRHLPIRIARRAANRMLTQRSLRFPAFPEDDLRSAGLSSLNMVNRVLAVESELDVYGGYSRRGRHSGAVPISRLNAIGLASTFNARRWG